MPAVPSAESTTTRALPPVGDQVERLVALGVPALAGASDDAFRTYGAPLVISGAPYGNALVVVHSDLVGPTRLVPLLRRGDKAGFVVVDLTDLDDFAPIDGLAVPDAPLYLVTGVDRGDDLRDTTPTAVLPVLLERGRTPLTVSEGISWLLQDPTQLEPNRCFMAIGSRRRTAAGLDARTPALWVSNGTGRDGRERRGAPKVGWCWAGNRHTWLGMASAVNRTT